MTRPINVVGSRSIADRAAGTRRLQLAVWVLLLLYPLLMIWAYRDHVAPTYTFSGMRYVQPDHDWIVATGVCLALVPAVWLPLSVPRPGALMVWIMYCLVYVPAQVIPPISTELAVRTLLALQITLLAGFLVMVAADHLPARRLPRFRFAARWFWAGFWIVYVGISAVLVWFLRLPTTLPTFGEVYDLRSEFIDRLAASPALVGYLYSWQAEVFNPFLIGYGLVRRRYALMLAGGLGQVYLYGTSGEKSLLFVPALIVGVYLVMQLARTMVVPLIAAGASALIVGSLALDSVLHTTWFMALFIHRLTAIPGQLTGLYVAFFSSNPKALLGDSILAPIVTYPYDTGIPRLIGREMLVSPEMIANANIWADGFANFGFPGIVMVSVIAGVVIWFFNALAAGTRLMLPVLLAAGVAFVWSNNSVFTAMLTNGTMLTLALLWLAPLDRPVQVKDGDDTP